MKIPKKVKIAGINYGIEIPQKILYDKNGNQVDGKCFIDKQKILFSFCKNSGEEYKELIFLHEITHLLFFYSGIGKSKLWYNEDDVHKFSLLLHSFLKDNKIIK